MTKIFCDIADLHLIKKFNNFDIITIKNIDLRDSEKAIISFK